jgi:hypothetical protein
MDHKTLAILAGEAPVAIAEGELGDSAQHVFDHIPGKVMKIRAFKDCSDAMKYLHPCQDTPERSAS